MKLQITLTLYDECAEQVVERIVYDYAMLTLKSRLTDPNTVNGPWLKKVVRGGSLLQAHIIWMRRIDKARLAYKKSLEQIYGTMPEVPVFRLKTPFTTSNQLVWSMAEATAFCRLFATAKGKLPHRTAIKALGL